MLFKYMHPILSVNQVSNRNPKNGDLQMKKGKYRSSDSPFQVGLQFSDLTDFFSVDMLVFIAEK